MSIKGIYYQAEIMGQTVTWIVPHARGFQVSQGTELFPPVGYLLEYIMIIIIPTITVRHYHRSFVSTAIGGLREFAASYPPHQMSMLHPTRVIF